MDGAGLALRLLLVGDCSVGKSSLLLRFTEGTFQPGLKPTIGECGVWGRFRAGAGGRRRRARIGAARVGVCPLKPSLLVGVDFKVKKMVVDGHAVQLSIWVPVLVALTFSQVLSMLLCLSSSIPCGCCCWFLPACLLLSPRGFAYTGQEKQSILIQFKAPLFLLF
ncbi:uncharacterized protein LOC104556008 isoform X4 [Colius striatus]|uniref:uncharacterized protein LOC104556008 isoform X4 n=1 Tax=Colius striatus TaxID=57412 RepID=UPI002B1E4AE0|nr:uncharacterized protein LOC104556008 isoform X4 [Colius striatus]